MVDGRSLIGACVAAAGLIVLCTSLSGIDAFPAAHPWRKDGLHPVAALAWAQAHCDSPMKLAPGTPKLQMDDMLEISSKLDRIEERRGHGTACANAEALAASVAQAGKPETSNQDIAFARDPQSR
jgi:hypothetical protein